MIKNIIAAALVIGSFLFCSKALQARFADVNLETLKSPVVVELFTSQGCSSCPPADRLLGEIGKNENIIPLSFHVTYWDRLGWPDTLGREFSTERQRSYAAHKNTRRIYTPQMIVNGQQEFVGSDRSSLNRALKASNKIHPIGLNKISKNAMQLSLPQIPDDGALNYMIRLYGVKSQAPVKIQRGENRGKGVIYHNAVVYEQPIGAWLGDTDSRIIKIPMDGEFDRFIVLAQKGGFGEIVAAGQISK